jgi:hypothetical protein
MRLERDMERIYEYYGSLKNEVLKRFSKKENIDNREIEGKISSIEL